MSFKVPLRIDEEEGHKFALSIGNVFEVEITSISVLGVSMFSAYFLPKGLQVVFEMNGKPFGLNSPIDIKGEIRYCRQTEGSRCKCGVKFLGLEARLKGKIANFISAKKKNH